METRHPWDSLRERSGTLLRNRKSIILVEILGVLLIPLLWGLLPIPRTVIPLLLWAWLSLWSRQLSWQAVGLRKPRSWTLTLIAGMGIGALVVLLGAKLISPLLLRLTGETTADPRDFSFLQGNLPVLLILLFFTWPLAAVAEEMVYRGYVLNRLTDLFGCSKPGWGISLLVSALMFGLGHGVYSLGFILVSSLAGLLYAGLYLMTRRNLWLSIVVHGVANTISFALAFRGM